MTIKANGSITGSGTVTMPNTVSKADIYISGLSSGSVLIQVADPAGTYVTDQTNGTVSAGGRYSLEMVMPAQIRVIGSTAAGPAVVYIVGI